ncbi:hypothetical protein ACFL2V_06600 [Pseudomonadota bacterium]
MIQEFQKYVIALGGAVATPESANRPHERVFRKLNLFAKEIINDVSTLEAYIKPSDFPDIEFAIINNKKSNAFAYPSKNGNHYLIGVYSGLVLRMYNILCEALRNQTNLLRYCSHNAYQQVSADNIALIDEKTKNPPDMAHLIHTFDQNIHTEESNQSLDDEYTIELIEDIVTYAIEFLIMHETAHILRNHFGVYKNSNEPNNINMFDEESALTLFCSSNKHSKANRLKRGLEADADMQAIFMSYRKMEPHIDEDEPENERADFLYDDIFLRCFAIGTVFMLLDNGQALEEQITDHPPSYLRLLYIQDYIRRYHEFESDIDDEQCVEECLNALLELENLAMLLNFNRGRWIRTEQPDKNGNYLHEINQLVYSSLFEKEEHLITSVSDLIDQSTDACFIDGVAL